MLIMHISLLYTYKKLTLFIFYMFTIIGLQCILFVEIVLIYINTLLINNMRSFVL